MSLMFSCHQWVVCRQWAFLPHDSVWLYVPGMTKNLISISTLENKGYIVTFEEGKVYILPKNSKTRKVIEVKKSNLFWLQFEPAHALVSCSKGLGELWHKRMAHLHHGSLNAFKEIVMGLPKLKVEQHKACKGCALGKYTKTSFTSNDTRSKGISNLVPSDVCGPMSTVSLSGY